MNPITRSSLWSLERYALERPAFRTRVMAHKKQRSLPLGDHVTLLFEDDLTLRYQVQEMLRIERIFEPEAIQAEIDAYNPLMPGPQRWMATMLIEYADAVERRQRLSDMRGIEDRVSITIEGCQPLLARADEDMARHNAEKTSAVHFLRFDLDLAQRQAVLEGANLGARIDHPAYGVVLETLPASLRSALSNDLMG